MLRKSLWVAAAGCLAFAAAAWAESANHAVAVYTSQASEQANQDARITDEVMAKLAQESPVDAASHIQVTTTGDGVVTLSGWAYSVYVARQALEDAHQTPGVTSVRDMINVMS